MNELSSCMALVSEARKEIGTPKRVLIALSGGVDSVALFCILKKLAEEEQFEIAAVHIHHGLRDSADQDAAFCKSLCEKYQVPFFPKQVHLQGRSEMEARCARYAAFADVYAAWQADAIALAHHQSDQAETVLLHLFRGSGMQGLQGMRRQSNHVANGTDMCIFRPLLSFTKETLRSIVLSEIGAYCTDETNMSDTYTRNFIRLHVLPTLKERMPRAEEAICRTADILQTENDYLEECTNAFLQKHACLLQPVMFVEANAFFALHNALRRRVLQAMLPFAEEYHAICKAASIQTGETVNLQKDWRIFASKERIYFIPPFLNQQPIPPLHVGNDETWTGDGIHAQSMPKALFEQCSLRYRQAGDMIQPFGMQGIKSLQDYFTDRKIDAPLRDHMPLLCIGKEVIWAIGVGPSEKVKGIAGEERILLEYPATLPYEKQ